MLTLTKTEGRFSCHSCMTEAEGLHFEIWEWCRFLCLGCAATLASDLMALAGLVKASAEELRLETQADLFQGAQGLAKPQEMG